MTVAEDNAAVNRVIDMLSDLATAKRASAVKGVPWRRTATSTFEDLETLLVPEPYDWRVGDLVTVSAFPGRVGSGTLADRLGAVPQPTPGKDGQLWVKATGITNVGMYLPVEWLSPAPPLEG